MANNSKDKFTDLLDGALSRRSFLRATSSASLSLAFGTSIVRADSRSNQSGETSSSTDVAIIETHSREKGITEALSLLEVDEKFDGEEVLLKPNFNTADPFPASTHNRTLVKIIEELRNRGSGPITLGERSGPPPTEQVLKDKGIHKLSEEHGFNLINFDELPEEDLSLQKPEQSHWEDGFRVARPILEADRVVSTCCLKTHQFGGEFTMSLKLSVGIVPREGYNYMGELHSSPHMRKMIAEINQVYSPDLIVMDGMEVFTDGGPSSGRRKKANLIVAGTDRVAVDAVGIAILKTLGSNEEIMGTDAFQQEQINRAVELGLGVDGPEKINLIGNEEDQSRINEIRESLS